MKVLVVEDNLKLSKNICEYLKIKWIKTDSTIDWIYALQKIEQNHYDIVILDINLPGKDGLTVCKDLRQNGNNIPIIMLTSRNNTWDIITWLNIWADDYLGKPFDLDELVSRLESLYRRTAQNKSDEIFIGDIGINISTRSVFKTGEKLELSTLEFDLLKYLAQNRWTPQDRATLFEKVWWDFDNHMFSRTVDMYISYLRKKVWSDVIKTIKWFGYVIE